MKKLFKIVLVLFSTLSFLSCTPETEEDLEATLSTNLAILIDTSAVSCKNAIIANLAGQLPATDINQMHYSIPQVTVKWDGANPLRIKFVRFRLTHPALSGGSSLCQIAGDSLTFAWVGTAGSDVVVAPGTTSVNTCPLRCGSVTMIDKSKDAFGTGSILVYGTTQNSDGVDESVSTTSFFNFEYRGTGI